MTTEFRKILSRAPTRIDLAGGTLDIWPLYTFLKSPVTINLGIDLFAETELQEQTVPATKGFGTVTLASADQKAELTFSWNEIETFSAPPALELHLKFLRHFSRFNAAPDFKQKNLKLQTIARSPAGAGLGGSSALSISMLGALSEWSHSGHTKEQLIEIARDVETTVIQVPAGIQDYYGAMFGGLQSLRWGLGAHEREAFSEKTLKGLEERLLLYYSGQSRNSGINNWALFKSFIDKTGETRNQFQAIADATQALGRALSREDWQACGEAIEQEWTTRRTLARGITTESIDHAFRISHELGARGGKICGAGGGGCFFVFVPTGDPELKARIQAKIGAEIKDVRALPFRAVPHGVQVNRA